MGLLSNSVAAHPYQNQSWIPPPDFIYPAYYYEALWHDSSLLKRFNSNNEYALYLTRFTYDIMFGCYKQKHRYVFWYEKWRKKKTYFSGEIPVNDCRNVWRGLKFIRFNLKKVTYRKSFMQRIVQKRILKCALNRYFSPTNSWINSLCIITKTWSAQARISKSKILCERYDQKKLKLTTTHLKLMKVLVIKRSYLKLLITFCTNQKFLCFHLQTLMNYWQSNSLNFFIRRSKTFGKHFILLALTFLQIHLTCKRPNYVPLPTPM